MSTDAGELVCLIEWVQKYNGLQGNLSNMKAQAEGFYNTLSATRSFNWGDDFAWDQDFEQAGEGSPTIGADTTWADDVDFVFFSGHGSPDGLLFGRTLDDAVARPCDITWGDRELEWIALDACNVLERDDVFDRWGARSSRVCTSSLASIRPPATSRIAAGCLPST